MSLPLIKADNIWVVKDGKPILQDVSFQINPDDFITVIGPNGAGKTTLLKVALGLITPTRGKLKRKKNISIGYMPQKLSLSPYLPMDVGTFLSLSQHKTSHNKAIHLLEQVGARHLLNHSLHNLSGGELQRVLLAHALMNNPDLLILDEPVQGVDLEGQNNLYKIIQEITKDYQCATLLVSHDLHFVMAKSAQVLCLNKHICCAGTPDVVKVSPLYKNLFGHKTVVESQVLVPYHHVHDHTHEVESKGCKEPHLHHDNCQSPDKTVDKGSSNE